MERGLSTARVSLALGLALFYASWTSAGHCKFPPPIEPRSLVEGQFDMGSGQPLSIPRTEIGTPNSTSDRLEKAEETEADVGLNPSYDRSLFACPNSTRSRNVTRILNY